MSSIFFLNWFQLENLLINNMHFLFLDLRSSEKAIHPATLNRMAKRVSEGEVEPTVRELIDEPSRPVVLICDDGRISTVIGERLASLGYSNILVVEGGARQLIIDSGQAQDS